MKAKKLLFPLAYLIAIIGSITFAIIFSEVNDILSTENLILIMINLIVGFYLSKKIDTKDDSIMITNVWFVILLPWFCFVSFVATWAIMTGLIIFLGMFYISIISQEDIERRIKMVSLFRLMLILLIILIGQFLGEVLNFNLIFFKSSFPAISIIFGLFIGLLFSRYRSIYITI